MTLYDDLGVDENASDEEIKAAYRSKAKKTHPDAGGDAETFGALTKAYDVLSDPRSRARYDETGNAEPLDDIDKRAETIIGEIFAEMLRRAEDKEITDLTGTSLITFDLVKEMRGAIKHGQSRIAAMKKNAEKKKRHYERLRSKISGKIMERIIDSEIQNAAASIAKADHEHDASVRALEMLGDYSHQPDECPEDHRHGITAHWVNSSSTENWS